MRLIDADALIQSLKSVCTPELCHDCGSNWCEYCCPKNDYIDLIEDAPTVEARPQGKWLHNSDRPDNWICSVCNCGWDMWRYESKELKYCPNCGAEMEKAVQNDK